MKRRLKELGYKVPTSIVEKSELRDLLEEAERQAEASGSLTSPKAPRTSTSACKLRQRLDELGIPVPDRADETELLGLLKEAEQQQPSTSQQGRSGDVTVTCTRGLKGVAHIEWSAGSATDFAFDPLAAEATVLPGEVPAVASDSGDGRQAAAEIRVTGPMPGGGGFTQEVVQGATFRWVRGECVGHGASGTVFKAMNCATGQLMAVKEVHMDLKRKADEKFKEAIETEIQLMQDLRHPNVVAYYGTDVVDTRIYMYLEYMAGGSIARVLDQFGPLGETLMASYARQLLNGLEYLHTRSPYIVHRDIKGANVLLGLDGVAKLADFGCSKREQETRSLTFGGSIPWMAPEVIAHARYGRAGDIWSFGCLIIEMAAAEAPWGKFDNLMAAMIKIGMSTEMPALPETMSACCRAFVRRCLNRDPGKRLSASELLSERFVRTDDAVLDPVEELLGEALDVGVPEVIPEEDQPLPKGWEKHFDPNYAEWYYWHRPTGRSVWERPARNGSESDDD